MSQKDKDFTEEEALKGLEETEGKEDIESLYKRLACLVRLKKTDEALALLEFHREEIFHFRPVQILKLDLSLRVGRGDFDGAERSLKLFEELPYESQEVEEALRGAKMALHDARRAFGPPPPMTNAAIHIDLRSHDDQKIMMALRSIDPQDYPAFYKDILKILVDRKTNISTRAISLMVLVNDEYEGEVRFDDGEKVRSYVPKDLPLPFQSDQFRAASDYLSSLKDLTVGRLAKNLLRKMEVTSYPKGPFEGEGWENEALAFAFLAASYLMAPRLDPSLYPPNADVRKALEKAQAFDLLLRDEGPIAQA